MIQASPSFSASAVRVATIVALIYSALHLVSSAVRQPFDHPNLAKFAEQATPLRNHIATGAPVHSPNPEQYGPVFFFVMEPLLRQTSREQVLANSLYAIQLLCVGGSFLLTIAVLKPLVSLADRPAWPLIVAWLAVVWMNFSPLYTILALKSVETWELLMISLGLFAYVRQWRWVAAIAITAAGLVKVLPFAFLYYWLITDRRTFTYACVALVALLLASHLRYGPEMGAFYLPRVVAGAVGNSYGLDWHENISLKAAIAKAFGHLPIPTHDAARTSGYFIVLTGWRRAAAVVLGDASVVAGVAWLTWTWLAARGPRSSERTLWEWSGLAVAILVWSPNTIFEYATIALGAISYALVRLATAPRRAAAGWLSFVAALVLLGGLIPRRWLNQLVMVEVLNRWTGLTHLTASEAYQYYCFPLAGLLLLALTIWRLEPVEDPGLMGSRPLDPIRSAVPASNR